MKSWTASPLENALPAAIVLVGSAADSYERLATECADLLADPLMGDSENHPYPPAGLWIGAIDVAVKLRTSLDWAAYAVWRQYAIDSGSPALPAFPVPKKVTHDLVEARNKLKRRFPGLATGNPDLLQYFEDIIENSDSSFDWLHCLHELASEVKHRMPVRQAPRSHIERFLKANSDRQFAVTQGWLSAETELEGFPNVLWVLGKAGCGVLEVVREMVRLSGVSVAVPPDGPFAADPWK
jgi:hypothetical protein